MAASCVGPVADAGLEAEDLIVLAIEGAHGADLEPEGVPEGGLDAVRDNLSHDYHAQGGWTRD